MESGVHAQIIPWQTFCGSAGTQSSASGTLIYTLGGCVNCGSLVGASGSLTTPFPNDDSDCFTSTFDYEMLNDDCGITLDFFYTGNANATNINFEWDFGPDAIPQTSTESNPSGIAYASAGVKDVQLRVFDGGDCDIANVTTIEIEDLGFAANPILTDISCVGGEDGTIQLEVIGGTAPFLYQWSTGITEPSIINLTSGDYSYTVTDAQGCISMNTVSLQQPDSLMVSVDSTPETCNNDQDGSANLSISGGTPPYSVTWNDGLSGQQRTQLSSGAYLITITDDKGCTLESSLLIDRTCTPPTYNVISPNGDDINDFWYVAYIENYPENELQIFNRWGDKVFHTNGYTNDWTGTNNSGQPLSAGAYYYVLHLNDAEGTILTGSVTIIR